MKIELRPGDIFVARNPMMLGRIINAIQKFWAKDNQSKYSHSGIILSKDGETFEALWTNKRQNLFSAYAGKNILIGRHIDMNQTAFIKGWSGVKHHEGKLYAGHRLLFFLFPPLAKYLNFGLGVCSELTAKFLFKAGLWTNWKGLNPDDIADRIHHWRGFKVIFEGVLQNALKKVG